MKTIEDGGHQKQGLLENKIGIYTDSQRLRQHARGPHASAPDGVLELKGEVGTTPDPEAIFN